MEVTLMPGIHYLYERSSKLDPISPFLGLMHQGCSSHNLS